MDRKLFMALLMSAGLATLVAAMFYRLTSARASHSPQLVSVVYAASSLPVGARVRPSDVKLISIPVSVKPRDSFARVEDVIDRPVIATIMQDEPVLKQRLSEPGSGAGLAPIIPPGFRAVSVRVNDVIGVAGYAEPGMKVDVLVTGHPPQSDETITRTVLQNIPVLSAGEVLQPEPKGQAINATLVTLQVTPREAELLALASDGGHIQLVLRNSTDLAIQNTSGAELSAMYGITRPHVAPASPPKPHAEWKAPQPLPAPVSKPAA
ncbi:MAG TPA: Flp pilus assembly protein CpaB, partial [Bryobacteraceae bacterium]|nr:Flp pilus assembly protein CpaB [Bryobacteraceae bacterium]